MVGIGEDKFAEKASIVQLAKEAAAAAPKSRKGSSKSGKNESKQQKATDIHKNEKTTRTRKYKTSEVQTPQQQPQKKHQGKSEIPMNGNRSSQPSKKKSASDEKPSTNGAVKPGSGILGTESEGAWYEAVPSLEEYAESTQKGQLPVKGKRAQTGKVNDEVAMNKRKKAEKLLATEVESWQEKKEQSAVSEDKWLQQVLKDGTLSDRVAAMTLMVQQSPLHNLEHLTTLIDMSSKKGRREREMTVESIKDLFSTNLLPKHRKLIPFERQPLTHEQTTSTHLVYWLFEDYLKQKYAQFISTLESASHDSMRHFRTLAVRSVYELLLEFPEQEAALLTLLVNKLGDADRKIASKATFLLQQLVQKHQAMKPIVVREVQQFLVRPSVSQKARYYAILFLSQLPLVRGWTSLADQLVTVYFSMFERCVKYNEVNSRVMSALLTGVNRAFPYTSAANPEAAGEERKMKERSTKDATVAAKVKALDATTMGGFELNIVETLETKADTLFKIAHEANFNTSVQALTLIFQVATARESFRDRFYTALYSTLFRQDLPYTNKHHLFLNLVYRALRDDKDEHRVATLVKRLLQVATYMSASFAAAVLYLVSDLAPNKQQLQSLVCSTESALPAYCSAEGEITSIEKGKRWARDVPEDEGAHAPARDGIETKTGDSNQGGEDSDNESNESAEAGVQPAQSDDIINPTETYNYMELADTILKSAFSEKTLTSSGVVDFDELQDGQGEGTGEYSSKEESTETRLNGHQAKEDWLRYDAHKRNPKFSNVRSTCMWELAALAAHYHPSVRRFATALMKSYSRRITYHGDPLADFTLLAFLDR
eukprot:gb/GECG01014793.1/.p1 GENE.gb/GECG01014793.1/~~gb/GECG01014793.1/.p1  ORF type:complete len:827 (+),score=142.82 gb/GECG01014793.1/:1-2481(+)